MAEPDLDPLYRERPEGFVAARNALVKQLRAEGERDEAARIAKLRRPSIAAWLLNLTALESPGPLEAFAEAGHELGRAQERALEGEADGAAEWRAAAEDERRALTGALDAVRATATAAGHEPAPRVLELVGETLRAAAGDPELRERVLAGRVEREQSAATLGTPTMATPPPPRSKPQGKRSRSSPKTDRREARKREQAERRLEQAQAKRDLERSERELEQAAKRREELEQRVERATKSLADERRRLKRAKAEVTAAKRKLSSAKANASR